MAITHKLLDFNERYLLKNWNVGYGNWTGYAGTANDSSFMNDHTIVKHADGYWHIFGIKKISTAVAGDRLFHAKSLDLKHWEWLDDILATEFDDPSFSTYPWTEAPSYIWAPHCIANPTAGMANTVHTERYVMAVTLVQDDHQEQLLAMTYSDDLETWDHDTGSFYDPMNATDHPSGTPGDPSNIWYYDGANWNAPFRDGHFWLNPDTGVWEMAVSAAKPPAAGGTWDGVVGRLYWDPTESAGAPDFSVGWKVDHAMPYYVVCAEEKLLEGPWVLKTKDAHGSDSVFIGTNAQTAVGGQVVIRVADLDDAPYNISTGDPNILDQWKHSQNCSYNGGVLSPFIYKLGWGGGWEIIPDTDLDSANTGKYIVSRFFGSTAESSSYTDYEHFLNVNCYNIGTVDFSQVGGTDSSPVVSWEDGLDADEWPTRWGSAFSHQPTFGDPKDHASRACSDIVISSDGYKHTALSTHVASAANAPADGGENSTYWDGDTTLATAAELAYYEPWTVGVTYYASTGTSIGLADPDKYLYPYYIDTWEDRQGPYKPFVTENGEPGSADTMAKRGYIKSAPWVLEGERISMKVAGGGSPLEFVALVSASNDMVLFKELAGKNFTLTDRLWDTTDLIGENVYLCIADMCATYPSGWIAVDTIHEYTREAGEDDTIPTVSLPIPASLRLPLDEVLGLEQERKVTTFTKAQLYDAVASKLRLGVEMLAPLASEMDEWALDCLRWLLPLAPDYALESVTARHTGTMDSGIYVHSMPRRNLKIIRVSHYTDGDEFVQVSPQQFAAIANQVPEDDFYLSLDATGQHGGHFGKGMRVWSNVMGEVLAYRVPAEDRLAIDYIPAPEWGADGTPSGMTIPHGWDGLLSTYCAVQVKAKEGDLQQADYYWKMLREELGKLGAFADVPKNVGG